MTILNDTIRRRFPDMVEKYKYMHKERTSVLSMYMNELLNTTFKYVEITQLSPAYAHLKSDLQTTMAIRLDDDTLLEKYEALEETVQYVLDWCVRMCYFNTQTMIRAIRITSDSLSIRSTVYSALDIIDSGNSNLISEILANLDGKSITDYLGWPTDQEVFDTLPVITQSNIFPEIIDHVAGVENPLVLLDEIQDIDITLDDKKRRIQQGVEIRAREYVKLLLKAYNKIKVDMFNDHAYVLRGERLASESIIYDQNYR